MRTESEIDVLRLLAKSESNAQIAEILLITLETFKTRKSNGRRLDITQLGDNKVHFRGLC